MLRGGTILLLAQRSRHGMLVHSTQQGRGVIIEPDTLDRIFDGISIFGPSMNM